jgi:quercetin 2,3-dioxygenase
MSEGTHVPAGGDVFQVERKVFGSMSIDFKVSISDTNGGFFVLENTDVFKGGPPRHLPLEQEEWFYVVESDYVVEIGDERYRLRPGDSVLALRKVSHIWAHIGEGRDGQADSFQPAGEMEAFFGELAKVEGAPQPEQLRELFRSHGMEVTGPPLAVE